MRLILQKALENQDLTGLCLCGPKGRRTVDRKEILVIQRAIQVAGYDPSFVVEQVRRYDSGRMSAFVLDPELGHYGVCVPVDILLLAAEGLRSTAQ